MAGRIVPNVPRYYGPNTNDCFINAYAGIIKHLGFNPDVILADYLSFMFEESTWYIGLNHLFEDRTTVEFSEEVLNTTFEFAYLPGTTYFNGQPIGQIKHTDRININWYIHDDAEVAYERTKLLIDADIPHIAFTDLYYLPYQNYYQKEHQIHAIIIIGYDEDDGTISIVDQHLISNCKYDGSLPKDVVMAGRSSHNPFSNPIVGEQTRPIRNLWVEINVPEAFEVSEQKLWNILRESCRRMLGQTTVLGRRCGLERIEALRNGLAALKDQPFDDKIIYLFRNNYLLQFKTISRSRYRFKTFIEEIGHMLPQDAVADITECLEQSGKCWEICSSLALKIGLSKRWSILDDVSKQLTKIIEFESKAIQRLEMAYDVSVI